MNSYELDRIQCCYITKEKKRCKRTGTHSDGVKVMCEKHIQATRVQRANDAKMGKK